MVCKDRKTIKLVILKRNRSQNKTSMIKLMLHGVWQKLK